jgi:hypothetical protein
MKVVILYRPQSEHSRIVEQYVHDFERQRGEVIELVSLETKEGAAMASLYDVVQYPALLALNDDGQIRKSWEGEQLPLMNEVAGYYVA